MEFKEYINVLTQAPVAVILMFFIYKMQQSHQEFIKEALKIIKKQK